MTTRIGTSIGLIAIGPILAVAVGADLGASRHLDHVAAK